MIVADSVASLLEVAAERIPDVDAVVDDDESLTYGELSERVAALARRIESVTRPQEPISILIPPSVDAVVALHAIARSGRVAIALDEQRAAVGHVDVHAACRRTCGPDRGRPRGW